MPRSIVFVPALVLAAICGRTAEGRELAVLHPNSANKYSPLPHPYSGKYCLLYTRGVVYTNIGKDRDVYFKIKRGSRTIVWIVEGNTAIHSEVVADCSYAGQH